MSRCPLLNKECIVEKCAWWMNVTVKDLKTQELYVEGRCVVTALGSIGIELCKNTGGVQAAVESNRNETIKRQDAFLDVIGQRLLGAVKRE